MLFLYRRIFMNKEELENLPTLVKKNLIKKEDAINKLWEEIYIHPKKYCTYFLTEDQKSDFLLYAKDKFEKIIDTFESKSSNFYTYLNSCLKNTFTSWYRKSIKRKLEEECVNEISITNYDIENDKYNSEIQKIDSEKNEPSFHLIKRHYTNKKIDILKKEIHILALKACQEIDDDIILRISDFIEMPKEVLLNQINNLRIKSNEKLIKHNNLIYRRNRAYFYKRRYNLELSKLLPESALYESIKNKQTLQTESWKKQNTLLTHKFLHKPTNNLIAKELGLTHRQVSFYYSRLRDNKSFIQKVLEENIFNE